RQLDIYEGQKIVTVMTNKAGKFSKTGLRKSTTISILPQSKKDLANFSLSKFVNCLNNAEQKVLSDVLKEKEQVLKDLNKKNNRKNKGLIKSVEIEIQSLKKDLTKLVGNDPTVNLGIWHGRNGLLNSKTTLSIEQITEIINKKCTVTTFSDLAKKK
ncbi:MAG: hypothetical protein OEL89_02965, partial [Candidatus Peregrinibacteria bacterium]|nr:hypothetical protein [Candidatus Peregrinibacteria bacterium]